MGASDVKATQKKKSLPFPCAFPAAIVVTVSPPAQCVPTTIELHGWEKRGKMK